MDEFDLAFLHRISIKLVRDHYTRENGYIFTGKLVSLYLPPFNFFMRLGRTLIIQHKKPYFEYQIELREGGEGYCQSITTIATFKFVSSFLEVSCLFLRIFARIFLSSLSKTV